MQGEERQSQTRLIQGLLVGVLGSSLLVALFALGRLLPQYASEVQAQLVSGVPRAAEPLHAPRLQPTTDPDPALHEQEVPATTTIGQPVAAPAQSTEWADLVLEDAQAVIRVPMDLAVEYKPAGLLSFTRDTLALEAWIRTTDDRTCEELVADAAFSTKTAATKTAVFIGEERGCRAQGTALTVVGFTHEDNAVLFAVEHPDLAELNLFEAVVASFRWQ